MPREPEHLNAIGLGNPITQITIKVMVVVNMPTVVPCWNKVFTVKENTMRHIHSFSALGILAWIKRHRKYIVLVVSATRF